MHPLPRGLYSGHVSMPGLSLLHLGGGWGASFPSSASYLCLRNVKTQ